MNPGPTRRALLLGALSVVVLAAQVSLTRIFSVLFWYHFGFLILSTSLLGFAAGGLLVRAFRERLENTDPDRFIAVAVTVSGPLLALALFVISHSRFSPMAVHESARDALALMAVSVALVPPFAAMGAVVLFILQRWVDDVDKNYAANLVGSGAGCLVALLLLDAFGGLHAYVALAAVPPLLAAAYAASFWPRAAMVSLSVGALVLGTLGVERLYPVDAPLDKPVACRTAKKILFSDWTSLSKVDICHEENAQRFGWGLWGMSRVGAPELPERVGVVIDYWAYTTILEHRDTPGYYDFYDHLPMYVGYEWVDQPRVLIIGAGGGMDIRAALHNDARKVDAVEINPSIFRALTHELREYSGGIYTHDRVQSHLGEGRRFVESSNERWDLIQLSGVDTHSATQAGAFALSENFLYTTEALSTYFEHLSDDGLLTLTRWWSPSAGGEPRFSMRLFTLAIESLADLGVENPEDHVVFLRSDVFTVILIKKRPVSTAEIASIERVVNEMGYDFIYRPDLELASSPYFYEYTSAADRRAWIDRYRFNIEPPTDDSPFFFEHRKLRDIYRRERFLTLQGLDGQVILAVLLAEMLVAGLLLVVISHRIDRGRSRPLGWLYFAAIGLGFMLVEVTLSQRLVLFLGHPVYALSIVLFTLLVSSGVGARGSKWLGERLGTVWWLLVVAVMMAGWALLGTPLLRALLGWPTPLRMAVAIALIAPAGVLMGTAFPEAVRRLKEAGEDELGVYWAWNGVASVTASVLAVVVAMGSGFSTVMWLAAACYVFAAALLPSLSRRSA